MSSAISLSSDSPSPWNPVVTVDSHRTIRNKVFMAWRRRAAEKIPQLAERVFAIRSKRLGLQWELERQLGLVIESLNDRDDGQILCGPDSWRLQFVLVERVEKLHKDVATHSAH